MRLKMIGVGGLAFIFGFPFGLVVSCSTSRRDGREGQMRIDIAVLQEQVREERERADRLERRLDDISSRK